MEGSPLEGTKIHDCNDSPFSLWEVDGCQMTEGYGACSTACSGAGQDCASCMTTACSAQTAACQSVACN